MAKYVYLSHPLDVDDPRPPAIPAPELRPLYTIPKDGASVQILNVANHTGTHMDSPAHVIPNGIHISAYQPEELIFTKVLVVDLRGKDDEVIQPHHLAPFARELRRCTLALFRFGVGKFRRSDPERFSRHCPGFGVEAARWLRQSCPKLRAIGMDVPSVACIAHLGETMAAHNELLGGRGRKFLIIEDMKLPSRLDGLRQVQLCPWRVNTMDSGPCTVIGMMGGNHFRAAARKTYA